MKSQLKEYEVKMFNKIAEEEENYDTFTEGSYELIFNFLTSKNIKLNGKILEAGCGTGTFGKRFLSKFENINFVGVDISSIMVEKANDGTENYIALEGDLENKELFSNMEFDNIVCPFILHHFPDISIVVKNFAFWIRKNGFVIIIEPNGDNPIDKLGKLIRKIFEFFLGKQYIIKKGWATPNETDHTLGKYKKIFSTNDFEMVFKESLLLIPRNEPSLLGKVKYFLCLILRKIFPKATFSGNAIIALFRKNS